MLGSFLIGSSGRKKSRQNISRDISNMQAVNRAQMQFFDMIPSNLPSLTDYLSLAQIGDRSETVISGETMGDDKTPIETPLMRDSIRLFLEPNPYEDSFYVASYPIGMAMTPSAKGNIGNDKILLGSEAEQIVPFGQVSSQQHQQYLQEYQNNLSDIVILPWDPKDQFDKRRYDPTGQRLVPTEQRFDQMEKGYGPMEQRYDQMEKRYGPMEQRYDVGMATTPIYEHPGSLFGNSSQGNNQSGSPFEEKKISDKADKVDKADKDIIHTAKTVDDERRNSKSSYKSIRFRKMPYALKSPSSLCPNTLLLNVSSQKADKVPVRVDKCLDKKRKKDTERWKDCTEPVPGFLLDLEARLRELTLRLDHLRHDTSGLKGHISKQISKAADYMFFEECWRMEPDPRDITEICLVCPRCFQTFVRIDHSRRHFRKIHLNVG